MYQVGDTIHKHKKHRPKRKINTCTDNTWALSREDSKKQKQA